MSEAFELQSDFEPAGDQPQAIKAIVDGLESGEAYQTLLGVTGSGKSIGYEDSLFVVEERDGKAIPRVVKAGSFIDGLLSDANAQNRAEAALLQTHSHGRYLTATFDPANGAVGLSRVASFVRHRAPEQMFRVTTACGRHVTVTGDHNIWVLRQGRLILIETEETRNGDCLPLPESLPIEGKLTVLDVLSYVSDAHLYVHADAAVHAYTGTHGVTAVARVPRVSGLQPYAKLSAIRHGTRGKGIKVKTFLEILKQTNCLGGRYPDTGVYVGGKYPKQRLPARLTLSSEVLRLFGYYLAEGNCQARSNYLIVSNRHPLLRRNIETGLRALGVSFAVRPSSDYQVSSKALVELIGRLMGRKADEKRLPPFWASLPDASLATFLTAYFDGDGTVGSNGEVYAVTASETLASDLAYALLRFGVWARIRRVWKRAQNSGHAGNWYFTVCISGQTDLGRFAERIGFEHPCKQDALKRRLGKRTDTNVDRVSIDGRVLHGLREGLGLSQRQLAEHARCSRPALSMIESGRRTPSRLLLGRLLSALRDVACERRAVSLDWHRGWLSLHRLCRVRWTSITAVERIKYPHPFVYDLSVPGPETFLAGAGGVFVHNTFAVANVIQHVQRPTLVLAPNKTLAAQLYSEMRDFFPRNAVEYFVSYYDYYQPEAYVPSTDTYIEKDASINEHIEQMRLSATKALLERKDTIIVATVSAIYGLGDPEAYHGMMLHLRRGAHTDQRAILRRLTELQYTRNDVELRRGTFRVRGDVIDIFPAESERLAVRVELFDDEIDTLAEFDPLTGEITLPLTRTTIYPKTHYVTPRETLLNAIEQIKVELRHRLAVLRDQEKLVEAQRLESRTRFDLEMIQEVGYCAGIENYSRYLSGRAEGEPPPTLMDYLPADSLLVIDESHVTVPQLGGMYRGDRSRKETLVEYGFRLPSALDNRPLRFDEIEQLTSQVIFVSATPGSYELERAKSVIDLVVRPTGLVDPEVEIRPVATQVDDLLSEIRTQVATGDRVLVTTLTKRMAEDLTDYLAEHDVRVRYLHSDIDTVERVEIIRDLRAGVFDVIVGINLLREGLDLPEVALVAILDADKQGFLRSTRSLIQTIGRAARNIRGKAIMYADEVTDAMRQAIDETERRRQRQAEYNEAHGITPKGIVKAVKEIIDGVQPRAQSRRSRRYAEAPSAAAAEEAAQYDAMSADALGRQLKKLEKRMYDHAKNLEFEEAARLRDKIRAIRERKFRLIEGGVR